MTPDDDPLDRWLAAARWPEIGPERTQRILARWRRPSPWRHAPRFAAAGLAAAVLVWLATRAGAGGQSIAGTGPDRRRAERRAGRGTGWLRAPTAYEAALVPARRPAVPPTPLAAALRKLEADPKTDVAAAAKPLRVGRTRWENELAAELAKPDGPRRSAAARLLGEIASARSIPALAALAEEPAQRGPAVAALARLADADGMAQSAGRAADPALRRGLFGRAAGTGRRPVRRAVPGGRRGSGSEGDGACRGRDRPAAAGGGAGGGAGASADGQPARRRPRAGPAERSGRRGPPRGAAARRAAAARGAGGVGLQPAARRRRPCWRPPPRSPELAPLVRAAFDQVR